MQLKLDKLNFLLQKASFTYAHCIPLLSSPLREVAILAYLLFRNGDTIEDAHRLTKKERLAKLERFKEVISQPDKRELAEAFAALFEHEKRIENPDHLELLLQTPFIMSQMLELRSAYPHYFKTIIEYLTRMLEGMQYWVNRHDEQGRLSLQRIKELEDYCYSVAGILGEMLTAIFGLYSSHIDKNRLLYMRTLEIDYAIGLQVANILKSFFNDQKEGRQYIPEIFLPKKGGPSGKNISIIAYTYRHLVAGILYVMAIPVEEKGIRQFCLIPIFLAAVVLNKLLKEPELLYSKTEVKIDPKNVKDMLQQIESAVISNESVIKYWERTTSDISTASRKFL